MEDKTWYHLDPDNNKEEPKAGLFCCRCKRKIKETQCFESFLSVEMHPLHYWVRKSVFGGHLLGSECAKKIFKVDDALIKNHG